MLIGKHNIGLLPAVCDISVTDACNAACDFAPVVMVNWEFYDNMTPQKARDVVDGLRTGADSVRPTRGAPRQCTWK